MLSRRGVAESAELVGVDLNVARQRRERRDACANLPFLVERRPRQDVHREDLVALLQQGKLRLALGNGA